jgi:anti-anti-sigma factor
MASLMIDLTQGSPPVLHVRGELDVATASDLAGALNDVLSSESTLVVDLADLTFVDAAGLRVILRAADACHEGGRLTLVNARRVSRLLELVGVPALPTLHVYDGCPARG